MTKVADLAPAPAVGVQAWQFVHKGRHPTRAVIHEGIEISWVTSGRIRFEIGCRAFEPGRDQLLIVPEEVEHSSCFLGPSKGRSIKLAPSLLARVARSLGEWTMPRLRPELVPAGRAGELARLIHDEARRPAVGQQMMIEVLAEALAIELCRGHVPSEMSHPSRAAHADARILRAQLTIEQRYSEPLSVEDLARAAGMSRYHFSRRFRAATGQSPYGYLTETRLRQAAALLRRGEHNVTEAALAVGLNDLGRFAGKFKELTGQSPTVYRRADDAR